MYIIATLGLVHEKFDVWTGPKQDKQTVEVAVN